jgi:ribulose-phosphate 3-epimerase
MSHSTKSLPILICPSLLSCDLSAIASDAAMAVDKWHSDWLHIDIMDGHFVPNLTFGPIVVNALRSRVLNAFFDCHLMVSNPEMWLDSLAAAKCNSITFHIEAVSKPGDLISKIRGMNMRAAIALSPETLVTDEIIKLLPLLDMVLIMTVKPGFGGQSFMNECLDKVKTLRKISPDTLHIQVDGGITVDTISIAAAAGANVFVAGTAIFKSDDPEATVMTMRELASKNFNKAI